MAVDGLIGMQYGSEGKGKIAAYLAQEYDMSVRVGAWQAGHTITFNGEDFKMQSIPCQWINPDCKIVIGAGGMLKLDILKREIGWIEAAGLSIRDRLYIDKRVTIGEQKHADKEIATKLNAAIGSTAEGIGACLVDKIERKGEVKKAWQVPELLEYAHVIDTIPFIRKYAEEKRVFIEGTQGCHLSVTTSHHYPKCTSRDPNISGLFSDVGLSPRLCRDIWGIARTYPIRVAGNSGDTGGEEITWDVVGERANYPEPIVEKTTVTKRVRRVFEFSDADIQEAIDINMPTHCALMFADYLDAANIGVTNYDDLTEQSKHWIETKEAELGIFFDLISTGKAPEAIIDRRQ